MKPRRGRRRERQGPNAGLAPGKPPLKQTQGRAPAAQGGRSRPHGREENATVPAPPSSPSPLCPPVAGPGRSGWASPGGACPAGNFCPTPRAGRPQSPVPPGSRGHSRATHLFHAPAQKVRRCNLRSEICNIPEHPTCCFSLASRPWIFHAAVSKVSAKDAGQDKSVLSFLSLSVSPN